VTRNTYIIGITSNTMQQQVVNVNVKGKKTTRSRFSRGMVLAVSRRIIEVHNEAAWLVESETTDDKFYKVTESGECECPDFQRRGLTCKHMWALIRRVIA
jgi:light-regulated signal transduction histidine kinase (bacteriophytochrome)